MRITCNTCGGENISQAASIMMDLIDYKEKWFVWNWWEDLQFEDYFFCKDCDDECFPIEVKE
jgi:hypothetical protein